MIRIPGRIPIIIHPTFWLVAGIIGYLSTLTLLGTLIWIGVIFVSVLFHEYGHALTAYTFGQRPRIELVALGGLTYHDAGKLPFWKQFFIVFNGPFFGFLLFCLSYGILHIAKPTSPLVVSTLQLFELINLFWTIVNLVPVLPLDGGQLLRIIFEGMFGWKGFRYTLMASTLVATGASLFFFLYQAFLVGALFFLFAYQSFDTWRRMKFASAEDRNESLKGLFDDAEKKLELGHKEEARQAFEIVWKKSTHGMIHNLSSQYLAFLALEKREYKHAYDLLIPIYKELETDSLCLLHHAAFEMKDYRLVVELSAICDQSLPSVEGALRNAYANAQMRKTSATIGWLQTAQERGLDNLKDVLAQALLDPVRQELEFIQWTESHS